MWPILFALAILPNLFGIFAADALTIRSGEGHDVALRSETSCNTPTNRTCWPPSYDIRTDYEAVGPVTRFVRRYTLVITEVENWVGPDGVVKPMAMLINGTYPGPVITADWGDTLSVTVVNYMACNGTSIHWHGIHQSGANLQDGVNGVTECPIPPGGSRSYTFGLEQYGTTWYHSHYSAQYANGVVGAIQINGPASSPYDIDLGVFPVSDYYYLTADQLVAHTKNNPPPPSDNVLFNGTNVHPTSGKGQYATVTLQPQKRHRLRIINTSAENNFIFSLAYHPFTIIAADLVPVEPKLVDQVFVAIGQRYDVIIEANQEVDNYWFNATFVANAQCGASVNPAPAAIFHYDGAQENALPTQPGIVTVLTTCSDLEDLAPMVSRQVPKGSFVYDTEHQLNMTMDRTDPNQLFTWKVDASSMMIEWDKPLNQYILESNTSYPVGANVHTVTEANQWVFWIIENDPQFPVSHPIHLHGHDFAVVGKSDANNPLPFTAADATNFNLTNPVRRDVTMLPSKGWVVIAFPTNNPGSWLFHCHITWHISGGLGINFVERPKDIIFQPDDIGAFTKQCGDWKKYYKTLDPFPQVDSGLRIRSQSLGVGLLE